MTNLPEIISMWSQEGKAIGEKCVGAKRIDQGKTLTTFTTPDILECPDGSIIERGCDGRGSWIYREFGSLDAAQNAHIAKCKKVEMEWW